MSGRQAVTKAAPRSGPVDRPSPWRVGMAFAAIYGVWGSTYLAALVGLEGFPPLVLAGLRFSGAGLLLGAWCLYRDERLPGLRTVARNGLSGILMLAGGTGSVIWAEQHISSGLAAILIAAEPLWFIAFDRRAWPAYFASRAIPLGLGIGLVGLLLVFCWPGTPATGPLHVGGSVAVLLGGISWVVGSLYAKYRLAAHSPRLNGSLQLLAAGVFCLLLGTLLGEWRDFEWKDVPGRAWLALAYMTSMGSVVAYTAYLWLLTVRPPAVVGTHTYVNPLVAVVLGWVFAQEPVLTSQVVALLVILLGVGLVNLPKYRKTNQTPKPLSP
ncbi:MAG: EamA family transporter [Cytophagales bacterium]|nr:EamA family transporter [Cytophagales bacterium]